MYSPHLRGSDRGREHQVLEGDAIGTNEQEDKVHTNTPTPKYTCCVNSITPCLPRR